MGTFLLYVPLYVYCIKHVVQINRNTIHMRKHSLLLISGVVTAIFLFTGCSIFSSRQTKINQVGKVNSKTGIKYSADTFLPEIFKKQKTGPGLVFIPAGTFMMGGGDKDIELSYDNRTRQVTVQSFYMDETEVSNVDWHFFLENVTLSGEAFLEKEPELKRKIDYSQSQSEYPGSWSADRIIYEELKPDSTVWLRDLAFNDPIAESYFQHPAFYQYPVVGINWHQANAYCEWRTDIIKKHMEEMKDGEAAKYPTPSYRLPTEAEWEFAARGNQESNVYAWEGKSLRNRKGKFQANFKIGRGDYAGWAGGPSKGYYTDGYMLPAPIKEFPPNDFGLYNMSGNVAEWCMDTYRVQALEDVNDLNSFRRKGKTSDWFIDDDTYDQENSLLFNPDPYFAGASGAFDNVKVYKGGSWADIAYYLSPGVRRFLSADSASATVGFRCAMTKVGAPR